MAGKVVHVQQVPEVIPKSASAEDILATLCYYYAQYTYAAARRLPYKRVIKLIKTAKKMEAQKYFNLTQIAAAPHTKDGQGVTDLSALFHKQARNG